MERLPQRFLPALGAWKPAKDAGFHIPTATATAAVKLDATDKPTQIERFYRFSSRTKNAFRAVQWTRSFSLCCGPVSRLELGADRLRVRQEVGGQFVNL
jgi:hypothetical protein